MHRLTAVVRLLLILLIPLSAAYIDVQPSSISFNSVGEERSVQLEVTRTVTHTQAFLNENGSWQPITLQSANELSNWHVGNTSATIPIREANTRSQGQARIATYSCAWSGSWSCPDDWEITTIQTTHPEEEPQDTPDGQQGDYQALKALYESTNGAQWTQNTGWPDLTAETMSEAHGITTETINGEERVVSIDLRYNNLQGSIDLPELANLKELRMFNVMLNNINSDFPDAITQAEKLEYLYLSGSDGTSNLREKHPHEEASDGGHTIHPGKHKGNERNRFHGAIPQNIDDLQNLKWFFLSWTDHIDGRDLIEADGITNIPETIWNIASLEGIYIYENWNIRRSGDTLELPESIAHMENLTHLMLSGGSGTGFESDEEGFVSGTFPQDMNQLTKVKQITISSDLIQGIPDLSGSTELRAYSISGTDFDNIPFPAWLVDGRNPKIDSITIASGVGDTFLRGPEVIVNKGLIGELPEINAPGIDSFTVSFNKLTGAIPESFWTTNPNGGRKNNFYHNQLTSLGTTDLTHLKDTNHIRVSHNNISEPWPKLNWESPPPLQWVWFAYNKYVFKHMLYVPDNAPNGETTFELYQGLNIDNFNYAPQKPFGEENSYTQQEGESLTVNDFNTIVEHKDNQYQWHKDGSAVTDQTNKELQFTNLQESNAGEYTLQVTNPGVPELTLQSKPITIEVTPAPEEPSDNLSDEILPNSEVISTQAGDIYLAQVASGLNRPWGLAFLPDGRMLVTERVGNIRLLQPDGTKSAPLNNPLNVYASGQGGMLDIALHPDFENNNWVYVTYSGIQNGEYMTHLARAKFQDNDLQDYEVLFRGEPAESGSGHFGSRIAFDDEGHVYFSIGDRQKGSPAQDLSKHHGSIIRLHDDGSIPSDNPFVNQEGALPEIYTYGMRNPQGLVKNPYTGDIWEHEHGPKGGDEVNIIYPGENYAWPLYTEGEDYGGGDIGADEPPEGTILPIHYWVPSIAPSGMTFYSGDKLAAWTGDLFLGALATDDRGRRVVRLEVTPSSVENEEHFLIAFARIRDIQEGPDEYLYFITDSSNDGRIYRLGPFVE